MQTRSFLFTSALLLIATACSQDAEPPTVPSTTGAQRILTTTATTSFRQISAGGLHTCGVTTDDRAYCWGANGNGQLGDGTTTSRLEPTAVVGGLRFRQVSAGTDDTCGVTTDDRAYCWGWDQGAEFGTGGNALGLTTRPVAVSGGLLFHQVGLPNAKNNRFGEHTCAVTPDSRAYCWGDNFFGALGIGPWNHGQDVAEPHPVVGDRLYREVSLGVNHTCGVAFVGRILCWGLNASGELGNGTRDFLEHNTPVRVSGELLFGHVSAGGSVYVDDRDDRYPGLINRGYTCALTTEDEAYCWGDNKWGQLGDGTGTDRDLPTAVAGNHQFQQISAGPKHTCAVQVTGEAYCWGRNQAGDLGDGTGEFRRSRPVPVIGGLKFTTISAGDLHTCGIATSGAAYCWGSNNKGQLGDGTTNKRAVPTPVGGL